MKFDEPEWFEQLTSTNTIVLERIDAGERLPDGYVLATTEQTAGRGRGTRHWHAEAGRDLCCSILYRSDAPARQLASLAMATALGIVDALHECGIKAQTKWPNDVLVDGAKIAGILCELRPGVAVIGIGLNVSMSATEADRIDQPATSILIETGTVQAPKDVLPILLQALSLRLDIWKQDGFAGLHSDWCRHSLALGQDITIDDGDTHQTGVLSGFGDAGQLLLQPHARAKDGSSTAVEIWSGHLRLTNR
jgi:BirA family transcriptional regulator, biotin operon repressor / biotin---[acetyl-CoA-carboxylase] ligase